MKRGLITLQLTVRGPLLFPRQEPGVPRPVKLHPMLVKGRTFEIGQFHYRALTILIVNLIGFTLYLYLYLLVVTIQPRSAIYIV